MIENVKYKDQLLAIIIRADYRKEGISFFTPSNFSQQLGYMNRPKGYIIAPHVHNLVPREVSLTQEVLYIRSGQVRVDFYDDDKNYLHSTIVKSGDVILLAHGGHGFEMLEQSEIIEIKQGPYIEEVDKVKFEHVKEHQINFIQGDRSK